MCMALCPPLTLSMLPPCLFAFAYHRRMSRRRHPWSCDWCPGARFWVPVLRPIPGRTHWPCRWPLAGSRFADNNNSGELRAGWEMPLICWSCQLSRSEMKWKSHALMAETGLGTRDSPLPPARPKDPSLVLLNGGLFLFNFFFVFDRLELRENT